MVFRKILAVAVFGALVLPTAALAQDVPAGAQSGVVEKSVTPPPPLKKEVPKTDIFQKLEYPKTELLLDQGKKVKVKDFKFTGNTIFSGAELKGAVAQFANKSLSFNDLQGAIAAVNALYIGKGYFLARAILPAQDVTSGIVHIAVVEGHLGEVIVQGNQFYTAEFIRSQFSCTVQGVLNYHSLLRSLILINEYPDLAARAVMQKGKAPYTVDILLTVEDKRPLHFTIDYNNFGSRYVSRHRTGAGMEYSNLVFGGDKISLRGVNGWSVDTLKYGSVGYSLPVNKKGTTFQASYARSDFEVQKEYRALDAHGESETISLDLIHPLRRNFTSSLDMFLGFDFKNAKNYLVGDISSEDDLRILRAGFTGNRVDMDFHGRDFLDLKLSRGLDSMGATKKDDPNVSRTGSGGAFTKVNMDLARYQQMPLDSVLMVKTMTQFSGDALPVSEQIAVGGANTVRGYPEAEHMGDYGTVINLELSKPMMLFGESKVPFVGKEIRDVVRVAGFYDYGRAYLEKPQAGEKKRYSIAGAGAGVRLDLGHNLNVKVDVGFPVSGEKSSEGDEAVTYFQVFKKF